MHACTHNTTRSPTSNYPMYMYQPHCQNCIIYFHVQGIVRALSEYQHKLLENNVSIFVRRGGPNYQEGLRVMREVGQKLGLNMHVFGPETHMTAIVGMALGTRPISRVQFRNPTPEPPSQKKPKLAPTGNKSVRS